MYARVAFEGVEVGEVAHVPQHYHAHLHPAVAVGRLRLCGQCHAVFGLYVYVVEVGHHAQHGHSAYPLHHLHAVVKQAHVAPELVYYYSLYQPSVGFALQHYRAVGRGEHSAAVDVGHEHHGRSRVARHGHVHYVPVAQVYLGYAARSLHHNGVVCRRQAVEGVAGRPPQLLAPLAVVVAVGVAVARGASVQHHLACHVAGRFQQHGVHVGRRRHSRRLGLHGLCAADFQSVGRHGRV